MEGSETASNGAEAAVNTNPGGVSVPVSQSLNETTSRRSCSDHYDIEFCLHLHDSKPTSAISG